MALVIIFITMFMLFTAHQPAPAAAAAAPTAEDYASARKLVSDGIWGIVSSLDYLNGNSPFGNVLSYSDGGKGVPFFYLTTLDEATANFTAADSRASLAVSQYAVDGCPGLDPQEPLCSKVTLSGNLVKLDPQSREAEFARAALLNRHPRFSNLPPAGNFQLYKLKIKGIFLINSYKDSPKKLSVRDYLKVA
ncbi:hypothetical protein ABFS82_08G016300 [Erythranthe guttata]|uniref:CREG-like beta-barrel domain-containing protein n=2 Tax=Erythranthe guttata TaxID=4155 RepID=A0A022S0E2_ERYGU|nr:hypothetical protein MIMGU_mgv1a020922mg [Erythranthe guttata]